jgi:hypothetical protein
LSFICRAMGYEDLVTLEMALTEGFQAAQDVIDKVVGAGNLGDEA